MENLSLFILARVLHVVGVVLWIGGVAFVTTVLIPALRRMEDHQQRFALFEKLEGRFAIQARIVTAVTGLSGFYMTHVLDGWSRFQNPAFWWMHLMVIVWLAFTLVLFVLEPLFLHRWFRDYAKRDSEGAFRRIQVLHWILLSLSLIAIGGAVAGTRGVNLLKLFGN
ncbi:MAG: DUF4149 domain-containing protein [Verrucomicrobiales bacterium]